MVVLLPLSSLPVHTAAAVFHVYFLRLPAGLRLQRAIVGIGYRCSGLQLSSIPPGAQWSMILVAGLFLPWLAVFAVAKPQLGLAGSPEVGRVCRLWPRSLAEPSSFDKSGVASSWPRDWLAAVATARIIVADHSALRILILGVLYRWRRPESWLVLVIAITPQTLMWYSFLVLLAIPKSYREACVHTFCRRPDIFGPRLPGTRPQVEATGHILWGIVVCTTFLPVVIAILRYPTEERAGTRIVGFG